MYAQDDISKGANPSEPFHVTDLAERLSGAEGAAVKKAVLARLDLLTEQLEVRLRSGVARNSYREVELLKIAVRAAHRFVYGLPVKAQKLF